MTIAEMLAARAKAVEKANELASLDALTSDQEAEYKSVVAEAKRLGENIDRKREAQELAARAALPVGTAVTKGADAPRKPWALTKSDPYEKDPSLIVGALVRLCAKSKADSERAFSTAVRDYGESHPVALAMGETKALNASDGVSGGFTIPPDMLDLIIPLLYAKTVVRKAGAEAIPMPNGTMTVPKMTSGASAYWIAEGSQPTQSQPKFGQVVATAKKLAALVPVTNDMIRYATSQFDAKVRNDMVQQISLAEDAAFIRSAGTLYTPRGLKSFAVAGQTLTSTYAYDLNSVNNELTGLVNKLESANLPLDKVAWLMAPRTKNYLYGVLNANGFPVYRDEMKAGKLFGYPFFVTTQIPTNLTVDANSNCSEIYLVDFSQAMILESRQLEFAISTEGVYVDEQGQTQSAFANDMTIIRALLAEDFQLQHDEAVAFDQGVAWSPAVQ